jgi:hypothetical protein
LTITKLILSKLNEKPKAKGQKPKINKNLIQTKHFQEHSSFIEISDGDFSCIFINAHIKTH